MKQRLLNDALGRLLHQQLFDRMVKFCEQYTPELPAVPVVTIWLSRFFQDDANIHILVTLSDNYVITGHNFIEVQEAFGYRVVVCHQAQADKGSSGSLDEGIEYIDKLRETIGAYCSLFTVTKHIKGLEKRYGYKLARTVMVKYESDNDEDNT